MQFKTNAGPVGWMVMAVFSAAEQSVVCSHHRGGLSRAMVFLVHFVNLVLFDFKILLTVPLMSLDHV